MSEIKNVGYTWMAKCNQLTPLSFNPFKPSGAKWLDYKVFKAILV